MILDKYMLYIFAFIFGVVIKIYDDLNDNNLFKHYDFLRINKKFINNLLQSLIVGFLTVLSFHDFIFCFDFTIMNILFSSIDNEAFSNPYELSGIILITLLCIFLFIMNNHSFTLTMLKEFIIIFVISITLIFIDIFILKNVEYGVIKLTLRFITLINLTSLMIFLCLLNIRKVNIISKNLILFGIGYLFTSCLFQVLLIYKNQNKKRKIKNKRKNKKII